MLNKTGQNKILSHSSLSQTLQLCCFSSLCFSVKEWMTLKKSLMLQSYTLLPSFYKIKPSRTCLAHQKYFTFSINKTRTRKGKNHQYLTLYLTCYHNSYQSHSSLFLYLLFIVQKTYLSDLICSHNFSYFLASENSQFSIFSTDSF